MDLRERYDPEDIEGLLRERRFDELLPEERAYVLRHLSGPEEYAAMRMLLLQLQDNVHDGPGIAAGPQIREEVLQAYRDQRVPKLRIWLNTLATLLIPREGTGLWRPALALGGIALMVVVTVVMVQRFGARQPLAEVKQQDGPALTTTNTNTETEPEPGDRNEEEAQETTPPHSAAAVIEEQEAASTPEVVQRGSAAEAMPAEDVLFEQALMADDAVTRQADVSEVKEERYAPSATDVSHTVTMDELARNMSVANASGKVSAAKRDRPAAAMPSAQAKSRSMADDPQFFELLSRGW